MTQVSIHRYHRARRRHGDVSHLVQPTWGRLLPSDPPGPVSPGWTSTCVLCLTCVQGSFGPPTWWFRLCFCCPLLEPRARFWSWTSTGTGRLGWWCLSLIEKPFRRFKLLFHSFELISNI